MSIAEKYGLIFEKFDLDGALIPDIRYSNETDGFLALLSSEDHVALKLIKVLSDLRLDHIDQVIRDVSEEYDDYWVEVYEIEILINHSNSTASFHDFTGGYITMPLQDLIDVLKEWKSYLISFDPVIPAKSKIAQLWHFLRNGLNKKNLGH